MKNVLLATTGSIGAKDTVELCGLLSERYNVRLVPSTRSMSFFDLASAEAVCPVYTDEREWDGWKRRGDSIMHIDLRNWADIFLVAPLTANTLAKFASGISDNLVSTIFRAWKMYEKPVVVAPSMNKYMWDHPITSGQLAQLSSWQVRIIPPRVEWLAGGDFGSAALPTLQAIVDALSGYVDGQGVMSSMT